MKVLLIPDKFKGSLTAGEVISAITLGIQKCYPQAVIHSVQASDGGEGFLDAIVEHVKCESIEVATVDPIDRDITAEYLYNAKTRTAYIELSKASGLSLLKTKDRNPLQTSTYGTGLLIKHAILKGSSVIYLGLGGSGTNDAGIGIAEALGYYFLDADGNRLPPNGNSLSKVKSIHKKSNGPSLRGISFFAVNDVDNPLYGPEGAAYTYAEQKGASQTEIKELDCGLMDFANVVQLQTKKDCADIAGSGAAGGTAYGLKVFCDATYISGTDFLLRLSNSEKLLEHENFDYIITGEGKFDKQTLHGKLINGVIDLGARYDVPVLALCGQLDLPIEAIEPFKGLTVLEIKDASKSLAFNMANAAMLLTATLESFLKK